MRGSYATTTKGSLHDFDARFPSHYPCRETGPEIEVRVREDKQDYQLPSFHHGILLTQ